MQLTTNGLAHGFARHIEVCGHNGTAASTPRDVFRGNGEKQPHRSWPEDIRWNERLMASIANPHGERRRPGRRSNGESSPVRRRHSSAKIPRDALEREGKLETFRSLKSHDFELVYDGLHPAAGNLIGLVLELRPERFQSLIERLDHPVLQAQSALRCRWQRL